MAVQQSSACKGHNRTFLTQEINLNSTWPRFPEQSIDLNPFKKFFLSVATDNMNISSLPRTLEHESSSASTLAVWQVSRKAVEPTLSSPLVLPFIEPEPSGQRIFMLHGIGGIGKTQIALAYTRPHESIDDYLYRLTPVTSFSMSELIRWLAMLQSIRIDDEKPKSIEMVDQVPTRTRSRGTLSPSTQAQTRRFYAWQMINGIVSSDDKESAIDQEQ